MYEYMGNASLNSSAVANIKYVLFHRVGASKNNFLEGNRCQILYIGPPLTYVC